MTAGATFFHCIAFVAILATFIALMGAAAYAAARADTTDTEDSR
jgi:hypothetical protein